MGASLSSISSRVDMKTFERLYREHMPLPEFETDLSVVFNNLKDDDGKVDRKTVLSLANSTDLYLAHEWGFDENGRSTHDRVSLLNDAFKKAGLITWFDEERESRSTASMLSPTEIMKEGIRGTQVVLVFITKRYVELVSEDFKESDLDVFYGRNPADEDDLHSEVTEGKEKNASDESEEEGLGIRWNFEDAGESDYNCSNPTKREFLFALRCKRESKDFLRKFKRKSLERTSSCKRWLKQRVACLLQRPNCARQCLRGLRPQQHYYQCLKRSWSER